MIVLKNNMWTKDRVQKFIKKHQIDSKGSLANYPQPKPIFKNNGDSWYEVILPFWSNNDSVVHDVLKFASDALKEGGCHISLDKRNNTTTKLFTQVVAIQFMVSCCIGD